MDQNNPSSVRVEVGAGFEGPEPDAPEPAPGGPGFGPRALAVAGVVAVIVVIALVALRPDEGETAAGTQRQETTTTTQVSPTTTIEVAEAVEQPLESDSDLAPGVSSIVNDVTGTGLLAEVVISGFGYSALQTTTLVSDGIPPVFRSDDGITWQRVEAAGVAGTPLRLEARFQGLRYDFERERLAIFRFATIDPDGSDDGIQVIDRLTLGLGDNTWIVDPEFEPIERNGFPVTFPGGDVALLSFDSESSSELIPLAQLLNQTLINPPSEPVCFAAWRTRTALDFSSCDLDAETTITAQDLRVPEDADAVFNCAVEVAGGGFRGSLSFFFLGSSLTGLRTETDPFIAERIIVPPTRVGGTVVSIGGSIPEFGPGPCDQFNLDRPTPRVTSLLRWNQPGVPEVVPIVGDFDESTFEIVEDGAVSDGEALFAIANDRVWRIDLEGNAEAIFSLRRDPSSDLQSFATASGTVFASIWNDQLMTWTIPRVPDGAFIDATSYPLSVGGNLRGTIIYLDGQIVIFESTSGELRTIVLPNS